MTSPRLKEANLSVDIEIESLSPLMPIEKLLLPTATEKMLLTLPYNRDLEPMSGGSNQAYLVNFENKVKGIAKPGAGEDTLEIRESWNKLFLRERAAYLVDKLLGLNHIPPTIIRKINGQEASVQEFIPDHEGLYWIDDKTPYQDQLYQVALLDYILWNKDRKNQHFLISNERVVAIDNGLSLDRWTGLYHIYQNIHSYVANHRAPKPFMDKIHTLSESKAHQKGLSQAFKKLVPETAINALIARTIHLDQVLSRHRGNINMDSLTNQYGDLEYHPGNLL